uniref:Uncharacterized protein n=1 Tax=viral metagenome TaxID=1070528 RepID=A0A6C0DS69_9ZZZZ
MKFITTIIKKFMPKELPKPVGRWNIENCNSKINYKVDLSNEDHCGPCGQYALTKIDIEKHVNKNSTIKKNNTT